MNIKRFLIILLSLIFLLNEFSYGVKAEDNEDKIVIVSEDNVAVLTAPAEDAEQFAIEGTKQFFTKDQELTVVSEKLDEESNLWYDVRFFIGETEYQQWIDADKTTVKSEYSEEELFELYLDEQRFPEEYRVKLRELHALHPEWIFEAYHTNLEWETALAKESRLGMSLIKSTNPAYLSHDPKAYNAETGEYIPYDSAGWFCANKETVAYYLDPRNFLNEKNIFMFVYLGYNELETAEVVQVILKNTFMKGNDEISGKAYCDIFVEAGIANSVSPVYLAVMARTEIGTQGSSASRGVEFELNGKTYSGLYNFFNIGATGGNDNWKKGLVYANGGEDGTNTSYLRPWTSPYLAITGGAQVIAKNYIGVGQNTMYLHKFNVTPRKTYGHQYMTNVRAAVTESNQMYTTYKNADCMDSKLIFSIPVFLNMNEKNELPTEYIPPVTPEPEPDPTTPEDPVIDPEVPVTPTEPDVPIIEPEIKYLEEDMIEDLEMGISSGFIYGFVQGTTSGSFKKEAEDISDGKIIVSFTDKNGKDLTENAIISTGQKLKVTDVDGTSNYTIIIFGDLNGDGEIDIVDLLLIKKDLLDMKKLSGAALEAACLNGEKAVSLKGYLAIKKYCLGVGNIEQKK